MDLILISELDKEDSGAIDAVRNYLAGHWQMSFDAVDKTYLNPSFTGSIPSIFVAKNEKGEFAGMIMLVLENEGYLGIDKQLWITGLFVPEAFRNRGIARRLIKTAEERCSDLGYDALYLDTAASADYYRHIGGWQEIGTAYWKEGNKDVTVMKKSLPS